MAGSARALMVSTEVKLVLQVAEGQAAGVVDGQDHTLRVHLTASGVQAVHSARVRLLINFPLH